MILPPPISPPPPLEAVIEAETDEASVVADGSGDAAVVMGGPYRIGSVLVRRFFASGKHDATKLFGSASPSEEELDEFLSSMSAAEATGTGRCSTRP